MKTSCLKTVFKTIVLFLTGCFSFLNLSCGLDTVYYIDGPLYTYNPPSYNNYDKAIQVFTFTTNEDEDYGDFNFIGTDVYYKIYTRYSDANVSSDAESEISRINSVSSDSTKTTGAYDLLRSYNYKPLNLSSSKGNVLIPKFGEPGKPGKNRQVQIRLYDYLSEYKAGVSVEKIRLDGNLYRYKNGPVEKSFLFSGKNETDAIPIDGDPDFSYTDFEPDKTNTYYVVLFAIAVGTDVYWTQYYSDALYLGCVPITVSDFQ